MGCLANHALPDATPANRDRFFSNAVHVLLTRLPLNKFDRVVSINRVHQAPYLDCLLVP